jgi:hypothetical protein
MRYWQPTQPAEGDPIEATVKRSRVKRVPIVAPCLVAVDEWSHLPTDQAEWARELMRRDAVDIGTTGGGEVMDFMRLRQNPTTTTLLPTLRRGVNN